MIDPCDDTAIQVLKFLEGKGDWVEEEEGFYLYTSEKYCSLETFSKDFSGKRVSIRK